MMNFFVFFFLFVEISNAFDTPNSLYDREQISELYNDIDNISPYCRKFMINYKSSLYSIQHCILKFSNPIHYCQECIDQFILFNQSYQTILNSISYVNNTLDNSTSLQTCEVQILQGDRVQPLIRIYDFIQDLWTSANCPDCFTFYKNESSGKINSYSLSNSTCHFYELYYEFKSCENNFSHPKNDNKSKRVANFCNYCATPYINLNKFYVLKAQGDINTICVDISDLMNHTYHKWREYYLCYPSRVLNIPFLTIQIFIIILPIFFYLGAYLHSSRKESIIVTPRRFSDYFQVKQSNSPLSLNASNENMDDHSDKEISQLIPQVRHSLINVVDQTLSSFSAPSKNNFLNNSTFPNKSYKRVLFLDDYNQKNLHNMEASSSTLDGKDTPIIKDDPTLYS